MSKLVGIVEVVLTGAGALSVVGLDLLPVRESTSSDSLSNPFDINLGIDKSGRLADIVGMAIDKAGTYIFGDIILDNRLPESLSSVSSSVYVSNSGFI